MRIDLPDRFESAHHLAEHIDLTGRAALALTLLAAAAVLTLVAAVVLP